MRKTGIDLPIIFMTAHGDIPMVRKVMKAGAVEFLTKPFQKEELLQAVKEAFALDRAKREEDDNPAFDPRAHRLAEPARAGGDGPGDRGTAEQANRGRVESQRDYGENSPAAHDGKDAGVFSSQSW